MVMMILALLCALKLPIYSKWLEKRDENGEFLLIKGIEDFREHLGGQLNITLPTSIGTAIEIHELNTKLVIDLIVSNMI